MNEETPKRRGRPRKIQPQPETPAIKEGATWNPAADVADTSNTVAESIARHNEAMQNKKNDPAPHSDIMANTIEDSMLAEMAKEFPVSPPEEVEQHLTETEKRWKEQHELTADSAIQIKEGPNRGVICQVGQVIGNEVHCYQQLANGEKTFLSTKMGEFIVLCPRRPGMLARKWEKKEAAPQWHDNKTHVPEGNK